MFTTHAMERCAGRAIPERVLGWLQSYGHEVRSHGCSKFYFTKDTRRRLARDIGPAEYRRVQHKLDLYAVVADTGYVVTAAFRKRRIKT
jgi:hypothetical protein